MNHEKNTLLKGLVGLAIILTLVLAACDNGTTGGGGGGTTTNPFKGSWKQDGTEIIFVIKDTTWQWYTNGHFFKGTYTYSGNDATFTVTHSKVNEGDEWTATSEEHLGSVSDSTLTIEGTTFTKQ